MERLKVQEKPLSKLTRQQEIRVKNIHLGIGKCFDKSLEESIYNFELDVRPEREIGIYEIMNVCFLEFVQEYNITDTEMQRDIFALLLGFSIGQILITKKLTDMQKRELYELWKINFYSD